MILPIAVSRASAWLPGTARLVLLADTLQLGVEQLDLALVEIGGKALRNRLRRLLHARVFGRCNLVEGHPPGLEFRQRLLGLNARLFALIIARLSDGFAHHLLLLRRELVPELFADEQDVLRESVVGCRNVFLYLVELIRQ